MGTFRFAPIALLLVSISGCRVAQKWPTYKGVENPTVLKGINGAVAFTPAGEAAIQRVGEPAARTIFTGTELDRAYTVAGPDALGRVALVDWDQDANRHWLRIIDPGRGTKTLFERAGDPLWGDFKTHIDPLSENVAMSPEGHIAFLVDMQGRQFSHPQAYIEEGRLEIWDASGKQLHKFTEPCLDWGISWFPDGKRLAVVRATEASRLSGSSRWPRGFGENFQDEIVPAVWILDSSSGEGSPVMIGVYPVVSQDGQTLAVQDDQGNVQVLDLTTGLSKSADLPGFSGTVIGLTSDGRAVYWAIATQGTKVETTQSNGLPGPRPMLTIKVVDLRTGKFATVVPSIDPRSKATFGFLR